MPYSDMLRIWLRFSGLDENAFWDLSFPEYERWFDAKFAILPRFDRARLGQLMGSYPDED